MTAADDAQMAADAVADLTGDGSAQAMVAQAAAAAAMTAATAAEEASARAQVGTVAAEVVAEQMTAETEQGNAETQLAMALELQRESQVAADAAGQVQQARDIDDARGAAKAAARRGTSPLRPRRTQKATAARDEGWAKHRSAAERASARADGFRRGEHSRQRMAETAATAAKTARDGGVDGCGRRGISHPRVRWVRPPPKPPRCIRSHRGSRGGHRGSAGYGRGHVLYGRHGCGSGPRRWPPARTPTDCSRRRMRTTLKTTTTRKKRWQV